MHPGRYTMRRTYFILPAIVLTAAIAACWDSRLPTAPDPLQPFMPRDHHEAGHCTGSLSTYETVHGSLVELFGPGSPNLNSAVSKLDEVKAFIEAGEFKKAEQHALRLIEFVQMKNDQRELPGYSESLMTLFINSTLCYARIAAVTGEIENPDDVWILSDPEQDYELLSESEEGGVRIPKGAFTGVILVAFKEIDKAAFAPGNGPLSTVLDQYPAFFELVTTWQGEFEKPVDVGVCVEGDLPESTGRVGHQPKGVGAVFQLLQPVGVPWLPCSDPEPALIGSNPRDDVVALTGHTKGFGGSSSTFSTFGGVNGSGGFGGSPDTFDPSQNEVVLFDHIGPLPASCSNVPEGSWVPSECRPGSTVATPLWFTSANHQYGSVIQGVTVTFTRTGSGGIAAVPEGGDCTSATPVAQVQVTSDANGVVSVCWQLGSSASKVTATVDDPPYTGDLEDLDDVVFNPASQEWELTPITTTMSFAGFYRPVRNGMLNRVGAAASIPIRFSLGGNQGLDIFSAGPSSRRIDCATAAVDEAVVAADAQTTSASGLTYHAGSAHYTFVWKTEKVWAGTCRRFSFTLKNPDGTAGTTHSLDFSFIR
jgi:hypothetical protein